MIDTLLSARSRLIPIVTLALAGFGLAAATFVDTRVALTRDTAPDAALALSPNDSDALALKSDLLLAKAAEGLGIAEASRAARLAVAARPVNARALRTLGILAQARGKDVEDDRYLALAARASRRDLGVQLWQIERAVAANNVPAVLQNYDVALRTNAASAPLLFPILTVALDDPEIRREFALYIRKNPPWLAASLDYAVVNSKNPAAILSAISAAGRLPNGSPFRDIENRLIGHLAGARQYHAARNLYVRLHGADAAVPQTVRFTGAATDARFRPMTWQVMNDAGVGSEFASNGGGDASLRMVAETGQSGLVAQKLLYLAPGRYHLSWQQAAEVTNAGANIAIDVSCLEGHAGTIAWQQQIPVQFGIRQLAIDMIIPRVCSVQMISIRMFGGRGDTGVDTTLSGFVLQRTPD